MLTTCAGIVDQMVAAVRQSPVEHRPFPHIYMERVFPTAVYEEMLRHLPSADCYRPASGRKVRRADGRDNRIVADLETAVERLDSSARDVWGAVLGALRSPELRAATWARLGVPAGASGYPRPLLVRDDPGYWIEPHPDSRAKRVTMQFYLARDGSRAEELGTVLYRLRPFRPAVWLRGERMMQRAGRLPFRPNSGYAFFVRWNSFHGVEPVPADAGTRHTLMNVYYREPATLG